MADTVATAVRETPLTASAFAGQPPAAVARGVAQASGTAQTGMPQLASADEPVSQDGQALLRSAERASANLARVPESAIRTLPGELVPLEAYVEANLPIAKAMPLVDIVYGGGVLVAVVIVQAIGLRLLTGHVDRRAQTIGKRPALWRVDLLLGSAIFTLLGLHLGSVLLWSAAVVYGGVIPDWVQAARFAARSYTTIGSDHQVPETWHMLGPIIAISGMFTFAWTASVLVSIVEQCNHLRHLAWEARRKKREVRKDSGPTTPPAG